MQKVAIEQLSEQERRLVQLARAARANAYAPYSQHKVGASVLTTRGQFFVGCNVEYVGLSQSGHAERNAITAMAVGGERTLVAVCCYGPYGGIPCAECRQAIWEFSGADPNVRILGATPEGEIYCLTIGELYPHPYGPESKGVDPTKF